MNGEKRRNTTKLVNMAKIADGLKKLTHLRPRPRLKCAYQSELNRLRAGEEATTGVRPRERKVAAEEGLEIG